MRANGIERKNIVACVRLSAVYPPFAAEKENSYLQLALNLPT